MLFIASESARNGWQIHFHMASPTLEAESPSNAMTTVISIIGPNRRILKINHKTAFIISNKRIIKLIEACKDGNIRIWNFHSGLLKRIRVSLSLNDFCLWNNNCIFVGVNNFTEKIDYNFKSIKLNRFKKWKYYFKFSRI